MNVKQALKEYESSKFGGKSLSVLSEEKFAACTSCCQWVNGADSPEVDLHQKRIAKLIREKAIKLLDNSALIEKLSLSSNFEELFDQVCDLFIKNGIVKFPCLLVYDVCLRFGFSKGIRPKDFVYLFRGAMEGAKSLGIKRGLKYRESITIFQGPGLFPTRVESYHIENMLCIYKHEEKESSCGKPKKKQSCIKV